MHYYRPFNSILIYGGKTLGSIENSVQNSIYLLRMDNLNWTQIETVGQQIPKRAGFCSTIAENKLIVFGGVSETFN